MADPRPFPSLTPVGPMALRDVFAAQIIGALLVAPKQAGVPRLEKDAIAIQAFELADAMMRIRDRVPAEHKPAASGA